MADYLQYEAWVNAWDYQNQVHKSGRGSALCRLEALKLKAPTAPPTFQQRLLVENAGLLASYVREDPFKIPCKKNSCKRKKAPKKFVRFWPKLILKTFAKPIQVDYVIQTREEWLAAVNLIQAALSASLPNKKPAETLLHNLANILEHVICRPTTFDCEALLITCSRCFEGVAASDVSRLAQAAIELASEATIRAWKFELFSSLVASDCACRLLERWRSNGVTGSASVEKLLALLREKSLKASTVLSILRKVAQTGGAASLGSNQSVAEYLEHVARDVTASFAAVYNATLLLSELFSRKCWDVLGTLLPRIDSNRHFLPFLSTSLSLNDLPALLELLPESYDVCIQDRSVLDHLLRHAATNTPAQALPTIQYAEATLTARHNLSTSWCGLVLAVSLGAALPLSEEALKRLVVVLRGHSDVMTPSLLTYWCAAIANFFNANLRDTCIELTILRNGPQIEYLPEEANELAKSCLSCCDIWQSLAPRSVESLRRRLMLQPSGDVFSEVVMPGSPVTAFEDLDTKAAVKLDTTEAFLAYLAEPPAPLSLSDCTADQCLVRLREIHRSWHGLISASESKIETFEAHVEQVVASCEQLLNACCVLLTKVGQECTASDESIYTDEARLPKLQRFCIGCVELIVQCIARPSLSRGSSFLNTLWFDSQFCPLLKPSLYLLKAAGWFYSDPDSPLIFKMGLAQAFADLLENVPRNFKNANLPLQPLAPALQAIRARHAKLKLRLLSDEPVGDDIEFQHELINYICSAVGD